MNDKSQSSPKSGSQAPVTIPATPLLKQIGYGTGVNVYHFERSPKVGVHQSPWALKKINKTAKQRNSYSERLKKEAEILKSISHPNIVGFRGFMETGGRQVLALEECSHCLGNLIEVRRESEIGPFEPKTINSVILGVSKALDYLHSKRKIIHGDIKSYNVLIKGNFEKVKLCDFGVSMEMDGKGEIDSNDYVGTSCWSPPEAMNGGPITSKADIFAFGLAIWEMLALEPPHSNNSENSTFLENSFDDWENSLTSFEEKIGTRPSLEEIELGPEYSTVVYIFNWCTEQDIDKRPAALDILNKLCLKGN